MGHHTVQKESVGIHKQCKRYEVYCVWFWVWSKGSKAWEGSQEEARRWIEEAVCSTDELALEPLCCGLFSLEPSRGTADICGVRSPLWSTRQFPSSQDHVYKSQKKVQSLLNQQHEDLDTQLTLANLKSKLASQVWLKTTIHMNSLRLDLTWCLSKCNVFGICIYAINNVCPQLVNKKQFNAVCSLSSQ